MVVKSMCGRFEAVVNGNQMMGWYLGVLLCNENPVATDWVYI